MTGASDVSLVAMGSDLKARILSAIQLKLIGLPTVWQGPRSRGTTVSLGRGFHVVNSRIPESLKVQSLAERPHRDTFELRCIGVVRGSENSGEDGTDCHQDRDDLLLLPGKRKDLRRFAASLLSWPTALNAQFPASAGGIKVTALFVRLLSTIGFFRRQTTLHAFGRSLGVEEVMKVMPRTTVSMLLVRTGIFLLSIGHDGDFMELAFEVTSAFGTVGLSRGITGELNGSGRAVIILTMFVGRVGAVPIGFFLATRSVPRVKNPADQDCLGVRRRSQSLGTTQWEHSLSLHH